MANVLFQRKKYSVLWELAIEGTWSSTKGVTQSYVLTEKLELAVKRGQWKGALSS